MQCLLRADPSADVTVTVVVRFLQLQRRRTERYDEGRFVDGPELRVDGERWFAWDEAVEVEHHGTAQLGVEESWPVTADAGDDAELIMDVTGAPGGRLVRERWPLAATLTIASEALPGALHRLTVSVENVVASAGLDRDEVLRRSLIGTHLILAVAGPADFVSVLDPPQDAAAAAAACHQHRCWPVLAGEPGDCSTVLGSPIILYDHPEIAGESTGSLFDATEIDEILMLRVLTMTDDEKAEARATDPKAAEIIDRCDSLTAEDLAGLHGALRTSPLVAPIEALEVDVEDPFAIFNDHDPDTGEVLVMGTTVRKGSVVKLRPQRRADAQDLFYADQLARVAAVHRDLDNDTHVAVVLLDDPAADLHDWYGRYLYFSPDEIVPQPANESR